MPPGPLPLRMQGRRLPLPLALRLVQGRFLILTLTLLWGWYLPSPLPLLLGRYLPLPLLAVRQA